MKVRPVLIVVMNKLTLGAFVNRAVVTVKKCGKKAKMRGKNLSRKEKILKRIQLIDELIYGCEQKISLEFFVQQKEALEKEIFRLNNERKKLAKQL